MFPAGVRTRAIVRKVYNASVVSKSANPPSESASGPRSEFRFTELLLYFSEELISESSRFDTVKI